MLKALVDIHTYSAYGRFTLAGALRETAPQVNTTDPTTCTMYLSHYRRSRPNTDSCAKQQSTPGSLQSLTLPRRLIQLPDTRRSEHLPALPSSLPCRVRLLNRRRRGPGGNRNCPTAPGAATRWHTCDQSSRAVESDSAESRSAKGYPQISIQLYQSTTYRILLSHLCPCPARTVHRRPRRPVPARPAINPRPMFPRTSIERYPCVYRAIVCIP